MYSMWRDDDIFVLLWFFFVALIFFFFVLFMYRKFDVVFVSPSFGLRLLMLLVGWLPGVCHTDDSLTILFVSSLFSVYRRCIPTKNKKKKNQSRQTLFGNNLSNNYSIGLGADFNSNDCFDLLKHQHSHHAATSTTINANYFVQLKIRSLSPLYLVHRTEKLKWQMWFTERERAIRWCSCVYQKNKIILSAYWYRTRQNHQMNAFHAVCFELNCTFEICGKMKFNFGFFFSVLSRYNQMNQILCIFLRIFHVFSIFKKIFATLNDWWMRWHNLKYVSSHSTSLPPIVQIHESPMSLVVVLSASHNGSFRFNFAHSSFVYPCHLVYA